MRLRTFKDPGLQTLYLYLLFYPPTIFIQHKQREYRRTGSSAFFPFWVGYDGVSKRSRFVSTSVAYVSWCAGVDYRSFGGRDYPRTTT